MAKDYILTIKKGRLVVVPISQIKDPFEIPLTEYYQNPFKYDMQKGGKNDKRN